MNGLMHRITAVGLMLIALTACGGGAGGTESSSSASSNTPPPASNPSPPPPPPPTPPTTLTISPSSVDLAPNATQTFTVSPPTAVNWSVDETSGCGSVTNTGRYTAPALAATCHVTVTVQSDASRKARATINVVNPPSTPPPATGSTFTITIDAHANVHAISPLIYGVASFDNQATTLAALNCPINRHGGNTATRYNWQVNAANHANDWFYESIADGPATPGKSLLDFVSASRQGGAESMITIPMAGWVAKLGPNRGKLASFSVAKYGAQQSADWQWMPDAGNGVRPDGSFITGNDPNDANVAADAEFQRGFLQLMVQTFGSASNNGVRYYIADNEHSIWHATHRDIHPQGASMDEIYDAMVNYGRVIKAVDPNAQIVGPEEWGWSGYLYSGKDQQYGAQTGNWGSLPDRIAHGNADYMPWLLSKLRSYEQQNGQRLLDVFSLHYYPQSGEYSDDVSTSMQQTRNVSTRSLWDPNYTDRSWINAKVQLIPRMKNWVAQNYPGLKIAITEYSWGADNAINGATAQADIFGIFGREGVDIATRWTAPASGSVTFKAMQMYRNYDGNKSTFGETSVAANAPNADLLSTFAALRTSDGTLTVIVINKNLTDSHGVNLRLTNFGSGSGTAQRWQLTGTNVIQQLTPLSYAGAAVNDTVPAQSITLYIVR